jgi:prefoldin subunit 5
MEKVVQMAEAHLQTVNKAINDLLTQKENIDQEIDKLKQYLERGLEEVNNVKAKEGEQK